MQVCIDVGNSAIKIGLFADNELIKKIVLSTEAKKADEYEAHIFTLLNYNGFDPLKVNKVIYSSVVPTIDIELKSAIQNLFKCSLITTLSHSLKTDLTLNVKHPDEVGSDLVADLVATKEKYGGPALIIDFGTATKILYLDENNIFQTCLLMPGLVICAKALSSKAALLPDVNYDKVSGILEAKDTDSAMANGIVYGHVESTVGIVNKFEQELGRKVKKIITGGIASKLVSFLPNDYVLDENLNVEGLNAILHKNK